MIHDAATIRLSQSFRAHVYDATEMAKPSALSDVDPDVLAKHMQRLNVRYELSNLVLGIVVEFHESDSNGRYQFYATTEEQLVSSSMITRAREECRSLRIRFKAHDTSSWAVPVAGAIIVSASICAPNGATIEHVLLAEAYDFTEREEAEGDERARVEFCQKLRQQIVAAGAKRVRVEEQVCSVSRPQKRSRSSPEAATTGQPTASTQVTMWQNRQNSDLLDLEMDYELDANDNDATTASVPTLILSLNFHKERLYRTLTQSVEQLSDVA